MSHLTHGWTMAIDFGTTSCVVAVRVDGATPEVVEVGGERRVPSVVLVTEAGELVVGQVADDLAGASPGRALRAPKRHIGEPRPVVIAGRPYEVASLVGALLESLAEAATAQMGSPPREVRLTHPATWGGPRREQLRRAATLAGLDDPILIAEPVAAAVAYAEAAQVAPGTYVAVYDLGGGTFDTTVLRATGDRTFEVVGRPTGDGQIGGELFDELLFDHLLRRLEPARAEALVASDDPAWRQASARLRTEVRRAKEAVSSHPYADVIVATPAGIERVRLERATLDGLIRPHLEESVEILQHSVADAGLTPDALHAVHLAGGATRSPLVAQMLGDAFPGVAISRRGDPKTSVAVGATLAAPATATRTAPPLGTGRAGDSPPGGDRRPGEDGRLDGIPGSPPTVVESQIPAAAPGSPGTRLESQVPPGTAGSPGTRLESQLPAGIDGDGPATGVTETAPPGRSGSRDGPLSTTTTVVPRRIRPPWLIPVAGAGMALIAVVALVAVLLSGGGGGGGSGGGHSSVAVTAAGSATGGGQKEANGSLTGGSTRLATVAPTIPPTSVAPTTAAPTSVPPGPTQAGLTAALLSTTEVGSGASPAAAVLCGNYARPTLYADEAFTLSSSGRVTGQLFNLDGTFPDAATASAQFAPIVASVPGCVQGTEAPVVPQPLSVPPICDQSYEGEGSGTTTGGVPIDFSIGLVRCGRNVGAIEIETANRPSAASFDALLTIVAQRVEALAQ